MKMPPKGKRGFKFTIAEMESLLDVIEEIVPIGNPDWERVWDSHPNCYLQKGADCQITETQVSGAGS